MNQRNDMTRGDHIMKQLFFFMLPMLLGNIFQQFYNIADTVIVGNWVGADALAAVGASGPIFFLFVAAANGMSAGGGGVIGQYFGAGDHKRCRKSITTFLIFEGVVATALGIVGIFVCKPILQMINTPANIIDGANTYLCIYMGGLAFNFLYFALSAVYRALGDSKPPLYFLIICTILNIVLDLVFVINFGWGVAGVAIATILSQTVCCVISWIVLYKKIAFLEQPDETGWARYYNGEMAMKMFKLAIPSTIQMSSVSLVGIMMQGIINNYGTAYIAAYTAANKVDNITFMPAMSIGVAMSAFTAQNIGAGKIKRVREGVKKGNWLSLIFCLSVSAVVFLLGPTIVSWFISGEGSQQIIDIGSVMVRFIVAFTFLSGLRNVYENTLKGVGDMNMVMLITIAGMVVRYLAALLMMKPFGFAAVYYSIPIAALFEVVASFWRWKTDKWKRTIVVREAEFDESLEV